MRDVAWVTVAALVCAAATVITAVINWHLSAALGLASIALAVIGTKER